MTELKHRLKPVLAPVLLLCGAGLVANLHAHCTGVGQAPLVRELEPLWSVVTLLVPVLLIRRVENARRAVTVLLVSGGLVALYGILQHFTGIDLFRTPPLVREILPGAQRFRVVGFFSHPLTFAYVYVFVFAFAVARALAPASGQDRWLGGAVAVVVQTALWMTGSRGAWLASLAGVLLLATLRRRAPPLETSRRLVRLVALAPALLLTLPPALLLSASPAIQARALQSLEPDNQRPRLVFWQASLQQVSATPLLGIGSDNFRAVVGPAIREAAPDITPPTHAHQAYLQLWVEGGLLALAGLLWLCARWLRLGLGWLREHGSSDAAMDREAMTREAMILGAVGGIVAFMLGGLTQDTLGDAEVQRTLAFTAAVLVAAARSAQVESS